MLKGSIRLEDTIIDFIIKDDSTVANVSVSDSLLKLSETYTSDAKAFMIALSIAIRWDGTPISQEDFKLAKTAQPSNPELRFIP